MECREKKGEDSMQVTDSASTPNHEWIERMQEKLYHAPQEELDSWLTQSYRVGFPIEPKILRYFEGTDHGKNFVIQGAAIAAFIHYARVAKELSDVLHNKKFSKHVKEYTEYTKESSVFPLTLAQKIFEDTFRPTIEKMTEGFYNQHGLSWEIFYWLRPKCCCTNMVAKAQAERLYTRYESAYKGVQIIVLQNAIDALQNVEEV